MLKRKNDTETPTKVKPFLMNYFTKYDLSSSVRLAGCF